MSDRTMTVDARSAILRARVRDYLARTGGTRGREQQAREDFIHAVIRRGRAQGMRLWKGDSKSCFELGMASLQTLLEEKSVFNEALKRWNTGRNVHWVLDLWEATLDHATRGDTYADRELPEDSLHPEEPVDGPDDGVRIIRRTATARGQSLSMRIVEAYLAHDDDGILELASEVSQMEEDRLALAKEIVKRNSVAGKL